MSGSKEARVLPLFDPETMKRIAERNVRARVDRITNKAIERVNRGATQQERDEMLLAVKLTCERLPKFTTDDIWETIESHKSLSYPRTRSLIGGTVRKAVKQGWCENTGQLSRSTRSSRHGGHIFIYRSRLIR